MPKLDYITAKNKYGKYCIPTSSKHRISSKTILKGEIWEEETIDFILSHSKFDLIHAGAYFGDMLPAFSSKFEKVWTFEPNKENYECAINTIQWNNLSNVYLTNAALGKSASIAILTIERNGKKLGGGSYIINQTSQSNQYETVNVITIDETIPEDRFISIIHLDVEHYELLALQGALKTINRCSPKLILETKPKVNPNLQQFLDQLNYKLTGTLHCGVNTIWEKKM